MKGWERSINTYRVSIDCDIYITGSNSKLLSGELATLLTGRYLTINVYPFSFKEFLQYKNEIEGIVYWKDRRPQCKIKRRDFGLQWPVKK